MRHGEVSGGEVGINQGKDGLIITISFEAIDVAFAANIASVYHGTHSNSFRPSMLRRNQSFCFQCLQLIRQRDIPYISSPAC